MTHSDRAPPTPPSAVVHRAAMAALAVMIVLLAIRALQRPATDLAVFHAAGARYLAGAPLYDPALETPYRYAPGIAALFAPLATLPFDVAKGIWVAFSALLVLVVALAVDRRYARTAALAVPVAWVCLAQPLAQELSHGQVDVLVLALAVVAFSADDAEWPFVAGILVALAAGLKVAPALLAIDWLIRRRWRALLGCLAGALLTALALIPRYGSRGTWTQHVDWLRSQSADAGPMIGTLANQSIWAWARQVGIGMIAGGLVVGALLLLVASERRGDRRRALLLASVPLVSAYGWPQLFVTAFPLLAATLAAGGAAAWMAGCAGAGVTLLSYDVAGPRVEAWAQGHRILGLLLLAIVVTARLSGRSARPGPPSEGS